MIQIENILKTPCSGVNPPVVRQSLLSLTAPDTGFLHSFSLPDYIEVIQNGGNYVIVGKNKLFNSLAKETICLQCNDKTVVSDFCGVSESVCTK